MQRLTLSQFQAGKWKQQYEYKSFSPNPINLQWVTDDPVLQELIGEASRCLGELNAYAQLIPDVDFFIAMHVGKEAQ
jgi:hypothetical protein